MYSATPNEDGLSINSENQNEILQRNMYQTILQSSTSLVSGWRALAFPIFIVAIVVMIGLHTPSAYAQQPTTQPTTGAATNEIMTPVTVAPASEDNPTATETSITETGDTKSYFKFELRQQAKRAFAGKLDVEGADFQDTINLSLFEGENFNPYFVFSEQTGPYKVNLYSSDKGDPILQVEGNVELLDTGEYRHQLISGTADPGYLKLAPKEAGVVIAVGSVDATVGGCISLYQPLDGRFTLGVDINGNGEIDLNESTTHMITAQSEMCLDTPEATIPLTSFYRALVTDSSGNVVAKNEGIYDFLNKTSVSSDKESDSEMVREFRIEWTRIPSVVQASILNQSLYTPPASFSAVPKEKGKTADIIQNGEADGSEPAASESDDSSSGDNPFGMFIDYWVYIAVGAGLAIALILTLKGLVHTPPVSRSNK